MAISDVRRDVPARWMATLLTLSPLAFASPSRAVDGPDPVVLSSPSQLPGDCASLGEISEERMMAMSPDPEKVQADAVKTARKKGATHLVTKSLIRCGPYSYCYTGDALRCPAPVGPSSGK